MAGLSPAPLPVYGTLFDPTNFGCGDAAPLPVFGTLFGAANARTLTADYGTFTLTGKAATLKAGRKISAVYGAFTLTGEDADLSVPSISGGMSNAAPLPTLSTLFDVATGVNVLFASAGVFNVRLLPAFFVKGYVLTADYGSFTASFPNGVCEFEMDVSPGAFALTGEDVTLTRDVPAGLVAATGNFVLTGRDAVLVYNPSGEYSLAAEPGVFTVTGFGVADLPRDLVLTADCGVFTVTGISATLVGAAWARVDPASSVWTNVTSSTTSWTRQ